MRSEADVALAELTGIPGNVSKLCEKSSQGETVRATEVYGNERASERSRLTLTLADVVV